MIFIDLTFNLEWFEKINSTNFGTCQWIFEDNSIIRNKFEIIRPNFDSQILCRLTLSESDQITAFSISCFISDSAIEFLNCYLIKILNVCWSAE